MLSKAVGGMFRGMMRPSAPPPGSDRDMALEAALDDEHVTKFMASLDKLELQGVSLTDASRALQFCNNDYDRALDWLLHNGKAKQGRGEAHADSAGAAPVKLADGAAADRVAGDSLNPTRAGVKRGADDCSPAATVVGAAGGGGRERDEESDAPRAKRAHIQVDDDDDEHRRPSQSQSQSQADAESPEDSRILQQPSRVARATSALLHTLSQGECGDDDGGNWQSALFRALGIQSSEVVSRKLDSVHQELGRLSRAPGASSDAEHVKQLASIVPTVLSILQAPLQIPPNTVPAPHAQVMTHQQAFYDATKANDVTRKMDVLKELCQAHVQCIKWWGQPDETLAKSAERAQHASSESAEMLLRAKQQWHARHSEMAAQLSLVEHQKQQADQTIEQLCKAQKGPGGSVMAALDVLQSQDPAVIDALAQRRALTDGIAKAQHALQGVASEGEYLSSCVPGLLSATHEQLAADVQEYERSFNAERERSIDVSVQDLLNWVPQLFSAVENYTRFQTERRTKATEKLEQRQAELADHIRLFGDDSPSERRELEIKVRELKGIVSTSSKCLDRIVNVQVKFWSSNLDDLPPLVRGALISSLNNSPLFIDDTSGAMKDLLARLNVQPGGGAEAPLETDVVSDGEGGEGGGGDGAYETSSGGDRGTPSCRSSACTSPTGSISGSPPPLHPLAVGQVIRTLFKVRGQEQWYEGEVTAVHDDGTYSARYSDGDVYTNMRRQKLVSSSPGEAERLNENLARASEMQSPVSTTSGGDVDTVMDDTPCAEDIFADSLHGPNGTEDAAQDGTEDGRCSIM